MSNLKTFCILIVFFAICFDCEATKKKRNIYTKEANEGDFKHDEDEHRDQEDEIIDEGAEESKKTNAGKEKKRKKDVDKPKETNEKVDPEKAKEAFKAIRQLGSQINGLYERSFGTLNEAITEIDATFLKVTSQAESEVIKIGEEKGKDLSQVTETIRNVIDDARAEFGEYRKILKEKEKETQSKPSRSAVEVSSEIDSKAMVKMITDEIRTLTTGGNVISSVMDDIPKKLSSIIDKTKEVLKERLSDLEKTLDVDLKSVKDLCEKSLEQISSSVTQGLKQTSSLLTMTLNTLLGLVTTLQASVQ